MTFALWRNFCNALRNISIYQQWRLQTKLLGFLFGIKQMKLFFVLLAVLDVVANRTAHRRQVVMSNLCNWRTCGLCGDVLYNEARFFAQPTKRARNLCYVLISIQGCCKQ